MLIGLAWQDHAVIIVYLASMLGLGALLAARHLRADAGRVGQEYFLAGRRMPWFAVGMSVIASILSSLTYLSEPGEVWNSGITHMTGKMLAIPLEMLIVWFFCIPFLMRLQCTSAYEYLEHRFGPAARLLGSGLFIALVVLWMGFVVLATSRALAVVSGVPLAAVIATVGLVATVYTMLGGLRAVIWTDVVQVVLLVGGGLFAIGFVAWTTGSWLPDWYAAAADHLRRQQLGQPLPLFSPNPLVRATILTVALNMCVWHVCTHTANQMTVQRYFSTRDVRAARRSFVTGSLLGVGLNLMLVVVGLAVLYYYLAQQLPLDQHLDPALKRDRDLIFPAFAVNRLPPGLGGGILAALLAAAMSSIDSGVNSIATVVCVEVERWSGRSGRGATSSRQPGRPLVLAMTTTLATGLFITLAAVGLSGLPDRFGIVDAMPRTFNAITAPLGGLFLIGIFLPRVGQRAAVAAAVTGLATSLAIGYFQELVALLAGWGWVASEQLARWQLLDSAGAVRPLSFTWVMPCSLLATLVSAVLLSRLERRPPQDLSGLTWYTRSQCRRQ